VRLQELPSGRGRVGRPGRSIVGRACVHNQPASICVLYGYFCPHTLFAHSLSCGPLSCCMWFIVLLRPRRCPFSRLVLREKPCTKSNALSSAPPDGHTRARQDSGLLVGSLLVGRLNLPGTARWRDTVCTCTSKSKIKRGVSRQHKSTE
jgi:hypothetical protein